MKLGSSLYSLAGSFNEKRLDFDGAMKFYRDNGIEYVEVWEGVFKDGFTQEEAKPIIEKYGLKASSYSVCNEFANSSLIDENLEKIKEGIDWAVYFGADKVRVFSANFSKEELSLDDAINLYAEAFKKIIPYAEEKKITLCLENHGMFICRSEHVKAIIEKVGSPYFKACADVGNFVIGKEDPLDAVKNLGEHIGFVHFKDFLISENGWIDLGNGMKCSGAIIGKGSVPLVPIVEYLKTNGYDNLTLSLEYEAGGDDQAGVIESFEYMKEITS